MIPIVTQRALRLIAGFEGDGKKGPSPDTFTAYKKTDSEPWTIYKGITGRLMDGREIKEGLVIDRAEGEENFEWMVNQIVYPLARKHFPGATSQTEFDAILSWVYNIRHNKLEAGIYSLPAYYQDYLDGNRPRAELEAKWLKYVNPGTIFELGLWRRRIAEICAKNGWPWRFAWAAMLDSDPQFIFMQAKHTADKEAGDAPKPAPKPPVATVKTVEVKEDPFALPEMPVDWDSYNPREKTAWLNTGQLRKLQKKGGVKVAAYTRPVEQVPYLEGATSVPVKRIKDSKRGQGFANQKMGQVIGGGAVVGLAAEQLGTVEPLLRAADSYGLAKIGVVFAAMALIGGVTYLWGKYLSQRGEDEATTVLE